MPDRELTVVLTHEHADFDAIASLLGASLVFPEAVAVLPRTMNRNVQAFLALYKDSLPIISPQDLPKGTVIQAILVDTRTFNAVKGMSDATKFVLIDHHSLDEPLPHNWVRWDNGVGPHEVGANTTLLVERLMLEDAKLSRVHATLLALGIYEDTGTLLYKSTTSRDVHCVAWLLEQGANLEVINRFVRFPLSPDQQSLFQTLIEQSEHFQIAGHSVVITQARAEGYTEEVSALAHKLRELYEPDVLFLIVDLGDRIQVVARSTVDTVDVGQITEALGGGGHVRAAAALIRDETIDSVRTRILEYIRRFSRPPMTVHDIMSRGRPQTLTPDTRIATAVELMRRYGHEGFPVVEKQPDGQETLMGILTRREADRAFSHGLGNEPVRRFMRVGSVVVHPHDPVTEVQKRMIESGWGQIPVVDSEGQIVGIVTRTDLIKLWGEAEAGRETRAEIAQRLAQVLSPVQQYLLQLAGAEAARSGQTIYVVGGFVRDLLLGNVRQDGAMQDMDIVIEGDAIRLAKRLQEKCGGRVVMHRRFGTAKWLLKEKEHPVHCPELLGDLPGELPAHLDFVTARTEFYTAPTVLPTVEESSIKLDLHRRDFTINTLAICLNPDRLGELLDFYGGLADLRRGVVRVLHSLSFVDDPTRILRAVRYEQRFGFRIDERTLELLQDAVELLDRVTPARIRHELERILQEEHPEKTLVRLWELGVLQRIHPQLLADAWLTDRFVRLRERLQTAEPLVKAVTDPVERLYWCLLVYRVDPEADLELTERLRLRTETQRATANLRLLQANLPKILDPENRPSQIVANLEPSTPGSMLLVSVAEQNPQLDAILAQYWTTWREVRPTLTGKDLAKMGIPIGPIYGQILWQLRAARLDGEIQTREEEEALARHLFEKPAA